MPRGQQGPRGRQGRWYRWAEDIVDRIVSVIDNMRARGCSRCEDENVRRFFELLDMLAETPTTSGRRYGNENCPCTDRITALVAGVINCATRDRLFDRPFFA